MLVWTDSGNDGNFDFLPVPTTEGFKGPPDRFEFCPVFFEKELLEVLPSNRPTNGIQDPRSRQPLSSLPGRYGHTVDWLKAASDPLSAIEELFTFYTVSELQHLNMLERLIMEHISEAEATQVGTDIGSILHFDYTKSILIRYNAHI